MRKQRVAILGSTGSIGVNALAVISRFPDRFRVVGLTANNNIEVLTKQVRRFRPVAVAVSHRGSEDLRREVRTRGIQFFDVSEICSLIEHCRPDIVILAISGSSALEPFLVSVQRGIRVAPANKEALVMAGEIIMREARTNGATVIPIDSEQSAIFQCLEGRNREALQRIILTASGGPLYRVPRSGFRNLRVSQILRHPRWKMGKKITVDSATLMNKGLEVIEAKMLFGVPVDRIDVIVHPQAVIHSMVELRDGSILAQLGVTDMRLPIQYALTYPERCDSGLAAMDLLKCRQLTFDRPDLVRFPALSLAFDCARRGGTLPCVMNAANEVAVNSFLEGRLNFLQIYAIVEKVVSKHKNVPRPGLSQIWAADAWAREESRSYLK